MRLRALPTWLITNAFIPFMPEGYPWRGRWFTLAEWRAGQTKLCREFDFVFWMAGASTTVALLVLLLV